MAKPRGKPLSTVDNNIVGGEITPVTPVAALDRQMERVEVSPTGSRLAPVRRVFLPVNRPVFCVYRHTCSRHFPCIYRLITSGR